MALWFENFSTHPVHGAISAVLSQIETILADSHPRTPDDDAICARLVEIAGIAKEHLKQVVPSLLPQGVVSNIQAQMTSIRTELKTFHSNRQSVHLINANNQGEAVLASLTNIPAITSKSDARGVAGAIKALKKSATQSINSTSTAAKEALIQVATLRTQTESLINEMANQKARLDQAITQFHSQFSTAEAKRAEVFNSNLASHADHFKKLIDEKSEEHADLLDEKRQETDAQITSWKAAFESATALFKEEAASVIQALEDHRSTAENLIHIITNTGMVGGFQKTANEMRRKALAWHVVATIGILGLIAVAVFSMIETVGGNFNWNVFFAKAFVAMTCGLLAAYGARQADKSEDAERRNRKMELELASIGPFLRDLPREKQDEIKEKLAEKFFAASESLPSVPEGKLNGNLIDVLKFTVETVSALAAKIK